MTLCLGLCWKNRSAVCCLRGNSRVRRSFPRAGQGNPIVTWNSFPVFFNELTGALPLLPHSQSHICAKMRAEDLLTLQDTHAHTYSNSQLKPSWYVQKPGKPMEKKKKNRDVTMAAFLEDTPQPRGSIFMAEWTECWSGAGISSGCYWNAAPLTTPWTFPWGPGHAGTHPHPLATMSHLRVLYAVW